MSKSVKKSAILVEGILDRKEGDHFAELSELAYVAGYAIVGKITQNLDRPTPDYFFGEGKAKEIKTAIKENLADIIIIENILDSYQYENLRRLWQVEIIDRFELILEIFINKAGTQEALTQIRLATLKKEGGSRLESHRTSIARDALIKKLEKKLELIKKAKDLRRQRRIKLGFDLVAIAGYTNSGKSTLMNTLTSANVEVSPKMFTTLDTKTSSFDVFGRKILITDTVGFISRLPNILIEAFYATLKEINEADLIILLVDGNDSIENIKRKILACMNTLGAIKANAIPLIPVLNKIDVAQKIDEKEKAISVLLGKSPIKISAKNHTNIEQLLGEIMNILQSYTFHLLIQNNNEGMSFVSKINSILSGLNFSSFILVLS